MSIARYKWNGNFTNKDLDGQIPDGFTGVIQKVGPEVFVDIQVLPDLAGAKEDLDAYMATLGWSFLAEDPTTPTDSVNQAISVYDNTGGQKFTGSVTVVLDAVQKNTASGLYTHDAATGEVTVLQAGTYKVSGGASLMADTATRTTSCAFLERNAVVVPGTNAYGYHRNQTNGESTDSFETVMDLAANDVLRLRVEQLTGSTLGTIAQGSRLIIQRI